MRLLSIILFVIFGISLAIIFIRGGVLSRWRILRPDYCRPPKRVLKEEISKLEKPPPIVLEPKKIEPSIPWGAFLVAIISGILAVLFSLKGDAGYLKGKIEEMDKRVERIEEKIFK